MLKRRSSVCLSVSQLKKSKTDVPPKSEDLERELNDAFCKRDDRLSYIIDKYLEQSSKPFICLFLEHDYSKMPINYSYLKGDDKNLAQLILDTVSKEHFHVFLATACRSYCSYYLKNLVPLPKTSTEFITSHEIPLNKEGKDVINSDADKRWEWVSAVENNADGRTPESVIQMKNDFEKNDEILKYKKAILLWKKKDNFAMKCIYNSSAAIEDAICLASENFREAIEKIDIIIKYVKYISSRHKLIEICCSLGAEAQALTLFKALNFCSKFDIAVILKSVNTFTWKVMKNATLDILKRSHPSTIVDSELPYCCSLLQLDFTSTIDVFLSVLQGNKTERVVDPDPWSKYCWKAYKIVIEFALKSDSFNLLLLEKLLTIVVDDFAIEALQYLITSACKLEGGGKFLPMLTKCLVKDFVAGKKSNSYLDENPDAKNQFAAKINETTMKSAVLLCRNGNNELLFDVFTCISTLPNHQDLLREILRDIQASDIEKPCPPAFYDACRTRAGHLRCNLLKPKPVHTLEKVFQITGLPECIYSFINDPDETFEYKGEFSAVADARKWVNKYVLEAFPYIDITAGGRGKSAFAKLVKTDVFKRAKTYDDESKEYDKLIQVISDCQTDEHVSVKTELPDNDGYTLSSRPCKTELLEDDAGYHS